MSSHVNPVSPRGDVKGPRSSARPVEVSGVEKTDEDVHVGSGQEDRGEDVSLRKSEEPEEAEVEEEAVEAQAPRAARAPHVPSRREIDEHDFTHCPYRAWCEHCVRGQAKDDAHRTVTGVYADSSVVRGSMDYCFLTEDVTGKESKHKEEVKANVSMTVLVMSETLCRSIWAYAVRSKGATEAWMVEQIVEDLETIGLSNERIILKADRPRIVHNGRATSCGKVAKRPRVSHRAVESWRHQFERSH